MLNQVDFVVVNRVGGLRVERTRLMHRQLPVYADHQVDFPVYEAEVMRNRQYGHTPPQNIQGGIELFFRSGIDIGRRLIQQQELRLAGKRRAIRTRCRWPPESAAKLRGASEAIPISSRDAIAAARSAAVYHPQNPLRILPCSTTSNAVIGKAPSSWWYCGM